MLQRSCLLIHSKWQILPNKSQSLAFFQTDPLLIDISLSIPCCVSLFWFQLSVCSFGMAGEFHILPVQKVTKWIMVTMRIDDPNEYTSFSNLFHSFLTCNCLISPRISRDISRCGQFCHKIKSVLFQFFQWWFLPLCFSFSVPLFIFSSRLTLAVSQSHRSSKPSALHTDLWRVWHNVSKQARLSYFSPWHFSFSFSSFAASFLCNSSMPNSSTNVHDMLRMTDANSS